MTIKQQTAEEKADLITEFVSEMIDNQLELPYRDGIQQKVMSDFTIAEYAIEQYTNNSAAFLEADIMMAVTGNVVPLQSRIYFLANELVAKHYDSIIELINQAETEE